MFWSKRYNLETSAYFEKLNKEMQFLLGSYSVSKVQSLVVENLTFLKNNYNDFGTKSASELEQMVLDFSKLYLSSEPTKQQSDEVINLFAQALEKANPQDRVNAKTMDEIFHVTTERYHSVLELYQNNSALLQQAALTELSTIDFATKIYTAYEKLLKERYDDFSK